MKLIYEYYYLIKKFKDINYCIFREKFIDNEMLKLEHEIFNYYHEYIKKQMQFYKLDYKKNIGEIYILFLRALFNYNPSKSNFKTYISKWIKKHALNYDVILDLFNENKEYIQKLTNYDSLFNEIQSIVKQLTIEQQYIFNSYYGLINNNPQSLRKIAYDIGCSHVSVHKKIRFILDNIKQELKNVFIKYKIEVNNYAESW